MVAVASVTSPTGTLLHRWGTVALRLVTPPDILTTGYGNRSAAELFAALRDRYTHLNPVVVDIRFSPQSEREEWNKAALQVLFGQRYLHLPCLGNQNYKPGSGPIQIADLDAGIECLAEMITAGLTPILLCGCGKSKDCHRTPVAEAARNTGLTTMELDWPYYVAPKIEPDKEISLYACTIPKSPGSPGDRPRTHRRETPAPDGHSDAVRLH